MKSRFKVIPLDNTKCKEKKFNILKKKITEELSEQMAVDKKHYRTYILGKWEKWEEK